MRSQLADTCDRKRSALGRSIKHSAGTAQQSLRLTKTQIMRVVHKADAA